MAKAVIASSTQASPYNDDLCREVGNVATDPYPSISVVSEVVPGSGGKNNKKKSHDGSEGGRKQIASNHSKQDLADSIDIVDLTLLRGNQKPTNKLCSEGSGESISRNLPEKNNFNRSFESSQDPKKSHRFNQLATITDPHNQSVVFEKDKLLEPSKDKLLEPSIDFQLPSSQNDQQTREAPKSKRTGGQRSSRPGGNSRMKRRKEANADIPDFLEQGQEMGCKCDICRMHLNVIKQDGMDPRILDIIKQNQRQDKFLKKQVICDKKMKELYHEMKKHSKVISQEAGEDHFVLQKGIMKEIKRIQDQNAIKFNKGDHFEYEEKNYSWLIQKLAGTHESTYMGCPVLIPETVIFTNGKPSMVVRTTREDDCINQIKGPMSFNEFNKYLLSLSKERTKEYQRKLQQIKFEQQALAKKQALERAKQMHNSRKQQQQQQQVQQQQQQQQQHQQQQIQMPRARPSGGLQQQLQNNLQPRTSQTALAQQQTQQQQQQTAAQAQQTSQQEQFTSARSRLQSNISVTSRDSKNSTSRQEGQFEQRQKRDAFLLRFKKDSSSTKVLNTEDKYLDKVIQEKQLYDELNKEAKDAYWQELTSISLTPMAKVGLGQLYTFEFISPCFEPTESGKKLSQKDQQKKESLSYYGETKFDFRQFGKDNNLLRKTKPLQFCLKMCHIIGFYLKYAHGFDLIKMKVDFNKDEFGEIWLMNVENLYVRKSRHVPSDNGTQLADYVLLQMQQLQKHEERRAKERLRESKSVTDDAETEIDKLDSMQQSFEKRTRSVMQTKDNISASTSTMAKSPQQISSTPAYLAATSNSVFRKNHPQYFFNSNIINHKKNSGVSAFMTNSFQQDQSVNNTSAYFRKSNDQQISKSKYLHDADNVHKINQLKELRLAHKKMLESGVLVNNSEAQIGNGIQVATANPNMLYNSSNHLQNQSTSSSSYITFFQQQQAHLPHRRNAGQTASSDNNLQTTIPHQLPLQSSSNTPFCDVSAVDLPIFTHLDPSVADASAAAAAMQLLSSTVNSVAQLQQQQQKMQQQQQQFATTTSGHVPGHVKNRNFPTTQGGRKDWKSLKEIERMMEDSTQVSRDCNQLDVDMNKKVVQGMKTFCPLLRKDNVIRSIKSQAKRHQEYRKTHFYHLKSFNGGANSSSNKGYQQQQRNMSKQGENNRKFLNKSFMSNKTGGSSQKQLLLKQHRESIKSQKSCSMRESTELRLKEQSSMNNNNNVNPFASGEALEQFEQRQAQKIQQSGDPVMKGFEQSDFSDVRLREFTQEQRQSQNMKKVLFNQQLDIQMRCDFIACSSRDDSNSSVGSPNSAVQEKEHPMYKYRQMTKEFERGQEQENEKLVKKYREEQQELERKRELVLLRSPTQQTQQLNQQRSVMVHDEDSSIAMMSSRRTNNNQMSPRETEKPGDDQNAGKSQFAKQATANLQDEVAPASNSMAEVVTSLNDEDFDDRRDSRARHLAQYILFSKEKQQQRRYEQNQQRSSGVSSPNMGRRRINQQSRYGSQRRQLGGHVISYDSFDQKQTKDYSYDEDPDVVARPLYKSFNAWPFTTDNSRSDNTRASLSKGKGHQHPDVSRQNSKKPMSNQKARAIVQQDYYYLSRLKQMQQSSSEQSLTNGGMERSHTGTAASTQMIRHGGQPISYEAFLQSQAFNQNRVSISNNAPRSSASAISSLNYMRQVANQQRNNYNTHVALVASGMAAKEQYSDSHNFSQNPQFSSSFSHQKQRSQQQQAARRNNRNNILNIIAGRATMPLHATTDQRTSNSNNQILRGQVNQTQVASMANQNARAREAASKTSTQQKLIIRQQRNKYNSGKSALLIGKDRRAVPGAPRQTNQTMLQEVSAGRNASSMTSSGLSPAGNYINPVK